VYTFDLSDGMETVHVISFQKPPCQFGAATVEGTFGHGPECDVPPDSHTDGQMIVRLRASVIVTLALLLSAATTYAQSMYLLWSHFTLRDGEHWQVHYAFESKKECKSAAAAVLREAARRGNTVAGDRVSTASGDLAPVCLPDTADPRGVKGK